MFLFKTEAAFYMLISYRSSYVCSSDLIALSDAANGAPNPVLNQRIVTQMLTKDAYEMGLGPGVHGEWNTLHFDHAGWNHGFRSYMVVYPYLGKVVVVMANSDGGDLLINEIVRSVARP